MLKGSPVTQDIVNYSLASWSQTVASVVLALFMMHFFTPTQFGFMSLVNTIANFLYIVGMMAVADQALPRFFLVEKNDVLKQKQYIGAAVLMTIIGNSAVIVFLFFVSRFIPLFFKEVSAPMLFCALVAVTCIAQSSFYVGTTVLKVTFQSFKFLKITVTKAAISACIATFGITVLRWNVETTILSIALITLFFGIWAFLSARRFLDLSCRPRLEAIEMLRFAFPLLGVNIFSFLSLSVNRILLVRFTSLSELGTFSVASFFATFFETSTYGFFYAISLHILVRYRESWAPKRYAEYFSFITVISVVYIVIMGLWGDVAVRLIKPDRSYEGIGVLIPWVLASSVLYGLGANFSPGPLIFKKTKWVLAMYICAASLNVLLCYFLIPLWGMVGAGVAATCSNLLSFSCLQLFSQRLYHIPNKWIQAVLVICLISSIVYIMQDKIFSYNFERYSIAFRITVTCIMIMVGVAPFYRDIKKFNVVEVLLAKLK